MHSAHTQEMRLLQQQEEKQQQKILDADYSKFEMSSIMNEM